MKIISNEDVITALCGRLDYLNKQIELVRKAIGTSELGALRISTLDETNARYYLRMPNKKETRITDLAQARSLAQLDYYRKILPILENECKAIERALKTNSKDKLNQVYAKMNPRRQELITPIVVSEEQRKERFLAQEFTTQPFSVDDEEHYSKRGLRVRSKSEVNIADMLDEYGIAYRYAPRTIVDGHVVYPDFVCLNARTGKEFFWEHNGMMASDGYGHHFTKKMNIYDQADIVPGENLIMTFEDDKCPLNYPTIRRNIERYLI